MYWLSGVISENLVYILQWSPCALRDSEEDWDLLRSAEEVVQSAAGERQVDCRRDGGTVAKDLYR